MLSLLAGREVSFPVSYPIEVNPLSPKHTVWWDGKFS